MNCIFNTWRSPRKCSSKWKLNDNGAVSRQGLGATRLTHLVYGEVILYAYLVSVGYGRCTRSLAPSVTTDGPGFPEFLQNARRSRVSFAQDIITFRSVKSNRFLRIDGNISLVNYTVRPFLGAMLRYLNYYTSRQKKFLHVILIEKIIFAIF